MEPAERRKVRLISREIIFEEFQRMSAQSTNVTNGQTDRQTTYHGNTALRYASREKTNLNRFLKKVFMPVFNALRRISRHIYLYS